jgi:transcriptional regulator with XRE-family HTH domain
MIIAAASKSPTKSVFTPEYAHFAARIVELRKEAGLTQVELARRLGRPQSYVSKYERGERRLDVVEFLAVARALGTDAAVLVAELERLREKPASRSPAGRPRGRTGPAPQRRE